MALAPDASLLASAATVTFVYGVYQMALPPVVDQRAAGSYDNDLASAERTASWIAAGGVAAVSLLAKDPTIFVLGGMSVIVLAWWNRHANAFNPITGTASTFMPRLDTDETEQYEENME